MVIDRFFNLLVTSHEFGLAHRMSESMLSTISNKKYPCHPAGLPGPLTHAKIHSPAISVVSGSFSPIHTLLLNKGWKGYTRILSFLPQTSYNEGQSSSIRLDHECNTQVWLPQLSSSENLTTVHQRQGQPQVQVLPCKSYLSTFIHS
ncbi:hypothetical protein TSUD_244700 [Trifolium subterraneum]|uniref:Uncharacterized protein n=1 Tax=Trifolium subterraneum TaxID=3900 RepID=A0A2Z6PDR6_TRISU|nr:hypothetical protein TSUD_244700 [Trifolium subterraneum]